MTGVSKSELGFDLCAARSNLVEELLELGVVTRHTFNEWRDQAWLRARTPIDMDAERQRLVEVGSIAPELIQQVCEQLLTERAKRDAFTQEDVEWEASRRLVDVHALLHGIPVLINGVAAERCEKWPCLASGASYGLLELCNVVTDRRLPAKLIADDLARLAAGIRKLTPLSRRTSGAIAIEARGHAALAAHVNLAPAPWNDCLALLGMIEPLADMLFHAGERARQGLWSKELRHARPGNRGRAKYRALTAVTQQLGHGGYTQQRIAELIPDDAGGSKEARIERVRHRLADADCRSICSSAPDD